MLVLLIHTFDLENIVRLVPILSHGNARLKSGFFIDNDILLPNMLAETIVTQRIVYEALQKAGGPAKVSITLELMNMVQNSHKTYTHAQE